MRSILTLALSLALAALLPAARASAQGDAEVTFELLDEGAGSSVLARIVPLSNGDLVCIGQRESGGGSEIYAMRIRPDGERVWFEQYAHPYASGYALVKNAKRAAGDEIVILSMVTGGATSYDYHLLRIDADGVLLTERTVDYYDWDLAVDLEVGPSNNVLLCGYGIAEDRYVVVKLDPDFGTLWTLLLGNPGQESQWPEDLEIAANGDVLVTGIVTDGDDDDVRIDRISPDGVLLYSKDFGDTDEDDADPIVRAGRNGGTYFAFRKAAYTANSEARIYRLDQSGNVQWGMVDADLAWVEIAELPNDEFLVAGVGPFSEGTNQTFRRFTAHGMELASRTVETVGFEHNWIRHLAVGEDGIFTTIAHATPEGENGTQWLVNSLTIDCGLVYQWALDTPEGDYGFPNAVVPVGPGAVVIGGEIGDVSDDDTYILRLEAFATLRPRRVDVVEGRHRDGDLASLVEIDGDRLEIVTDAPNGAGHGGAVLEIACFVPAGYPAEQFELSLTSRVSVPRAMEWVQAWDASTGSWQRAERTELSTSDTTLRLRADSRMVDPATGEVKIRVRCRQTTPISPRGFLFAIDQVCWTVRP